MRMLFIGVYILITIYAFLRKREYILATILVGQPILKLMLGPFPNIINKNMALIIYLGIGFFSLIIIRLFSGNKIYIGSLVKDYLILYFLFLMIMIMSLIYTPNIDYGLMKVIEFISISLLIMIVSI